MLASFAIPSATLKKAIAATVLLLVPLAAFAHFFGTAAALGFGMGMIGGIVPALALSTRYALALTPKV